MMKAETAGVEEEPVRRWCKKPPRDVCCMAMSPDGRYVYCLGQTVLVFDRQTGGKQRLRGLGNTKPFVSRDGRFLGGVHPSRDALEVTLWRIGETHAEVIPRVRIRSQIPPFHPCFTADGAHLLLDAYPADRRTGAPLTQLWAVSTADGSAKLVHEFAPSESAAQIDSGPEGVLISVHSRAEALKQTYLMLFTSLDEPPRRIDLSLASPLFNMGVSALWRPDGQVLLQYHQCGREPGIHLQCVTLTEDAVIHPTSAQFIPCSDWSLTLSPDGQYAAMHRPNPDPPEPELDTIVAVCRTDTWQQTFSIPCEYHPDIAFSPDSQWLLVGDAEPVMEPRHNWQ